MLKSPAQSVRSRRPAPADGIRERILSATLQTLKDEGFAGTSARAIARRGDFNQALIFYHFGSIPDLMLAALDRTSGERLERYRAVLADVSTLTDLAGQLSDLFREDMDNQHIAAIQELVAGSSSNPELGREIVKRLQPWMAFMEEVVDRLLSGTPFDQLLPRRDIVYAAVALYMGLETLTHLDGDRTRVMELFETGRSLAPMMDMLLRQ